MASWPTANRLTGVDRRSGSRCASMSTRYAKRRRFWHAAPRLNGYEPEHVRVGVVRGELHQKCVRGKLGGEVVQGPWQEHLGLGVAVPIGIASIDVEAM